jgi:hypothetical protein
MLMAAPARSFEIFYIFLFQRDAVQRLRTELTSSMSAKEKLFAHKSVADREVESLRAQVMID